MHAIHPVNASVAALESHTTCPAIQRYTRHTRAPRHLLHSTPSIERWTSLETSDGPWQVSPHSTALKIIQDNKEGGIESSHSRLLHHEEIVDHSNNILDIQESHSTGLPGSLVASQSKVKELVASLDHTLTSTTDTSPDTTMGNSQPCPPVTEVASLAPSCHQSTRQSSCHPGNMQLPRPRINKGKCWQS